MKRAYVFAFAAALVAAAPAVAHAVQHEGAAPHASAPHGSVDEAPADGASAPRAARSAPEEHAEEHAAPKPINWTDFSNHEQPPYVAMLLNFVLLMGMYYWLGRKPIAEGLKNRRANVAREIEEAQRMRHEAEERALKYQDKLKHLEVELKETRDSLRAAGEAERDRIVREAEEKATRMEKDARFLVEQELKQMRSELTRDAIEMAVAAAEELLRKRITGADQERLAEDYLSQLSAKRPSGSQEARPAVPGGE